MTQFEVTMSPSAGVAVTFKVEEGTSKAEMAKITKEAAGHLRTAYDGWEDWSKQNSTERERAFKKMRIEQEDMALEQWEEQKRGRAAAMQKLRGI